MARSVRYDRDGDVGLITLDEPPLNLFGLDLTNELIAALEEAEGDMIRALVVRADGKVFTGGVDVHVFADKTPEQAQMFFDDLLKITHKLEDLAAAGDRLACRACASRPGSRWRSRAT